MKPSIKEYGSEVCQGGNVEDNEQLDTSKFRGHTAIGRQNCICNFIFVFYYFRWHALCLQYFSSLQYKLYDLFKTDTK